jgi:hypothetical protein
MKTIILTKAELDSLPSDVQEKVMKVYNERENTISELKTRIKNLPFREIDYRTDNNDISAEVKGGENLKISLWEKTGGEEWGNCAGSNYTFRLGKKYIRMYIESFATNRMNWDGPTVTLSAAKLAEIIDLLEEAYKSEETDKGHIVSIVASRIKKLDPDWNY